MLILFAGQSGTQETFRYIEEKLRAGAWTWDIKTNAMQWSRGVYALFGLPETVSPTYDLMVEMIHRDDRRKPGEMERVVAGTMPINRELRIVWRNGRVRWIESIGDVLMGPDGKAERAIGVMRDITYRRETFQKLEAADGRLQALTAAVRAPVWTAQMDGRITGVKNWQEVHHTPPEDILGDAWIDYIHPDDRAKTIAAWDGARARREIYEVEHRVLQDDGSYRWTVSRAVPVAAPDGDVTEYVGVSFDIESLKALPAMTDIEHRLTGAQIRAARGILRWSVKDLADHAKVSASTIRRLEEIDGLTRDEALAPIAAAFTKSGVAFFAAPSGKPAVAPR